MQAAYEGHDELRVLEEHAGNYNQHIADQFASVLPRLQLEPSHPPVVIDFGAGIGTISRLIGTISRLFRATTGISPVAVKLDPYQRQVLKERGFEATPGLFTVQDGSVDFRLFLECPGTRRRPRWRAARGASQAATGRMSCFMGASVSRTLDIPLTTGSGIFADIRFPAFRMP